MDSRTTASYFRRIRAGGWLATSTVRVCPGYAPGVAVLERESQLAELETALDSAGAGRGSLVLVTGEPGAGKTTLLREFAALIAPRRVVWGLCDDLVTPRPLGPLRDLLGQLGVSTEPEPNVLDTVVTKLSRPHGPTVAVIEDAHWADAATIDVVRFLGRRVGHLPALFVVTFREDEVPPTTRCAGPLAPSGRPTSGTYGCPRCPVAGSPSWPAATTSTRCTTSPVATRSMSPRYSPPRKRPCPPRFGTRSWLG